MATKRAEITDFIVGCVDNIIPGYKKAGELARLEIEQMDDAQFATWVEGLAPKALLAEGVQRSYIPFYLPNLQKEKVSIARCFKIVRELGYSLSHRLVMTDPLTGVTYLTPHEYPCMDIVARRQAQTAYKKRSIPGVRQQIDALTGQPTATSKGSRISSPEAKFLDSRGLVEVQRELMHVRGGAVAAYRAFKKQLFNFGEVDMKDLAGLGPAKSSQVLSAYLNAQHLGNNILPGTAVPEDALPNNLKRS